MDSKVLWDSGFARGGEFSYVHQHKTKRIKRPNGKSSRSHACTPGVWRLPLPGFALAESFHGKFPQDESPTHSPKLPSAGREPLGIPTFFLGSLVCSLSYTKVPGYTQIVYTKYLV